MPETQALGTFGVYRKPSEHELEVIEKADQYRKQLVAILHERHRAMINLRNDTFPELYAAMVVLEFLKSMEYATKCDIKSHHSDVRDRNAVKAEQEISLKAIQAEIVLANQDARNKRKAWNTTEKAFKKLDIYAAFTSKYVGETYVSINNVLVEMASRVKHSLTYVDGFMWYVATKLSSSLK